MDAKIHENRLYVVTGATGNTGSVGAETLLSHRKRVRVIGRNPNKLQRFVRLGVSRNRVWLA